ncbi:hypothetical protein [Maribacter hydrothermalis]|uniref:Uncharacterized protein n=1 Tax=Maribacter hydrothermalis TaxID=1836467 RepID=A0A1B7Z709_9FLAO|nr:hypothetical protein [Maribacter hydrothermalis]APQ16410.1 hypothetical protein BTR34_03230 [Maribacter hydrothermalis]OBR38512.1 hypothetical protein A9200_17740 [Maribacter hydrothermalis]
MASIKELKKNINNVLGDIIEGVYIVEAANGKNNSKEGSAIVDQAIVDFDELIAKVNQSKVENKKAHFNEVRNDLETRANKLVDSLNKLA